MTTVAEAVTESQRRLEQLAHGVRDRGKHTQGWTGLPLTDLPLTDGSCLL